jgi:hypothetical protein
MRRVVGHFFCLSSFLSCLFWKRLGEKWKQEKGREGFQLVISISISCFFLSFFLVDLFDRVDRLLLLQTDMGRLICIYSFLFVWGRFLSFSFKKNLMYLTYFFSISFIFYEKGVEQLVVSNPSGIYLLYV